MTLTRKGKYWHYRFDVGGVTHRGSTRVKDRGTAQAIEDQLRKDAILQPFGLGPAPSLGATIKGWLLAKVRTSSASHIRAAKHARTALESMLETPLSGLATSKIEAWRADYLGNHSPAGTNQVLRYLKLWVNWAHRMGHLRMIPFNVKPLRVQQRVRPTVGINTFQVFLDGVDTIGGDEVKAAIRVALWMGLRESEILGMRWAWLRDGTYTVGIAKSKRTRVLVVPVWVAPYLEAIRPDLGPVLIFPGHAQGWLRKAIARGCKAAGLPRMGIHRLRASCATLLSESGTQLPVIQDMLGHADIRTTRGYVEVSTGAQAEAQHRLAHAVGFATQNPPSAKPKP